MQRKKIPLPQWRAGWLITGIMLLALVASGWWLQRQALAAPTNPVVAAWAAARDRGAYHFTSDFTQVNTPLATLANVGRSSRQTALHLEGATDLRAATMNLHLWSQEGNVSQPDSGVEVRVIDGKTEMRQAGGAWKPADDLLGGMAPSGDFLAFLAGMRDIQPLGTATRGGLTFTRYGFQLDGPAIAGYVREQMTAALQQKGELPPGLELQAPASYAQMTGHGELWIDQQGLPLRQTLALQFPPQRGEEVTAQIVTNFSNFAPSQATAFLLNEQVQTLSASALGLGLGLFAVAVVLTGRRSRRFYAALAIAIIFAQVGGPLLQNVHISAFVDAQQARAAAQEQEQTTAIAIRTAYEQATQQQFNPNTDPVAAANVRTLNDAQGTAITTNEPPPVAPIPTPEPLVAANDGKDSDSDGLTDFVEERIGTSPILADTDGDGVADGVEVKGFDYAGKHWFGDPLQRDSNNDGQADTLEWLNDANHDGLPDDTDGNGIPDAFDNDNDGDGVPDAQDLSPYAAMRPGANAFFNKDTPLRYQVNHLQSNSPTFVDFQLRPRDAKHLWYALNVLDWPQDVEGQFQDGDGKTFADLPGGNAIANPADANGDMKLIPMLEIRVPTGSANLAPASDLLAYNVAVHDLTADGATKVLYAPLRLMSDEKSGARVAFSARIPQWAVGPWEQPYEVRLVWVVQALTDFCDRVVDGLCQHYNVQNQPQVIQSYDDEWLLTGLSVREEHGSNMAVIYEDPAVAADPKDDATLFLLAHGLDNSFLAGRDQDHNGQRDLNVAEIARRFDRATNSAVSEDERWAIPNTLRVEAKSYDTLDRALMTTAMTETKRILDANFAAGWAQDNTRKPVLMFAHEDRYRSQGLDGLNGNTANNGYVHQHNGLLIVDLDPTGFTPTPLAVNTGLKWTMYCSTPNSTSSSAPSWNACDATTMWNEVAARYADKAALTGDDAETILGRMGLIRFYFLALAQGVNAIVQQDATILVPDTSFKTDADLVAAVRGALGGAGKVVALIVSIATSTRELTNNVASRTLIKVAAWAGHRSVENQLARLGSTGLIKTRLKALWEGSKPSVIVGTVIVAVIALGAIATLAFFKFSGNPILEKVVGGVILIAVVLVSLYSLINVITSVVQVTQGLRALFGTATAIATTLRGSSALAGTTRAAGVIGAVIQVGIIWGFFIYQMIDTKTSLFSPQFNAALAQAIAATILVITLAVLAATVVGLIIVGVIALIDGILTAICELGVDALRKVPGLGGACFTLNGAAVAVLAKALYAYDAMIDTSRDDLVTSSGPKITLADPTRGYVADNPIAIAMNLTTTVVHKDPERQNWYHILPFLWLFSEDNIRGTTFQYSLTQGVSDVNAERHQMDNAWTVQRDHTFIASPMYRAQANLTPQINNLTLPAGLNQTPHLYLNTGYALPAYECWSTGGLIRVCYVRTLGGHNSTRLDQLKLDILPPTLDQFMALTDAGNGGLKLGWDAQFQTLADADGDGLRSTARQGNDPNDATWDADGDGLSDSYELQWRSQGVAISPVSPDTDGDGLPDAQELQLGTNPASKDSDNDGLLDGDEVYHQVYTIANGLVTPTNSWVGGWTVVITGTQTLNQIVSSDPTSPDSDGDGISDQAEKELATNPDPHKRLDPDGRPYHPLIVNKNPLVVQVAVNDTDRIVKPGQTLLYTTTVANLGAPFTAGGLQVNAPAALTPPVSTYRLALDQTNLVTTTTNLLVAGTTSQKLTITSLARARLSAGNVPAWQWQPATPGTLGGFTSALPAWRTAVAPLNFSSQDSYAVTALNRSATQNPEPYTQLFAGQAGAWNLPAGVNKAFGGGQLHDASPTDVACNAFGRCFFVWSQFRDNRSVIMGMLTNQDLSSATPTEFVVAEDMAQADYDHYFHPVVASDGTNFLVAYEGIQQRRVGTTSVLYFMSSRIVARRFDVNGNPLGNAASLPSADVTAGLANPLRISYLNLDVAWIGDAYRVLWSQPKPGQPNNILQVADFDAAGAVIAGSQRTLTGDVKAGDQTAPQLAYDPLSGRSIVAYLDSGNLADTILFQNRNDANPVLTNQQFALGNVGVAYHPGVHGWLLSWTPLNGGAAKQSYTLLNSDGTPVAGLTPQTSPWAVLPSALSGSSLACPPADSQPVLVLPFEELPGATTFTDASGWNANATCTGDACPVAGIDGAPGAPRSDFAVRFNGGQKLSVAISGARGNRFSLAFWLKTSAATGGDFALVTNDNWRFVLRDGRLNYVSNLVNVTSNVGVADGQWHHIVLAQNEVTALIYVDGQLRTTPTDQATAGILAPGNVTIGAFASNTAFFTGELDQLQVYNTTLDQATVQAIKDNTQNAYCLATSPASTAVNTLRLNLAAQDTRGGVIKSSAGVSLTVDADPPTSNITSLTDGGYVQGTPGAAQTLIIGGNANDANGVQGVQVSVNGGGWQVASGGATWVYPLQVAEGRYGLQSRATDVAGNVESTPGTTTVIVDAGAPQIQTDFADQARLVPVSPIVGQWQIGLQGTAVDPAIAGGAGSGVQQVEVMLQNGSLNVAGNGWQPAALTDQGIWSLNYPLDSAPNLSGVYTVTVRAADRVGNAATLVRLITLDAAGPNAQVSAVAMAQTTFAGDKPTTIEGSADDPDGVSKVEMSFVPIQRMRALSDTLLFLPFDETSDERNYHDISPLHTDVNCVNQCIAGQPGQNDGALRMIPGEAGPLQRPQAGEFDFTAGDSFSLQSWLLTTQTDGVILSKEDAKRVGYALVLQEGVPMLRLNGGIVAKGTAAINDKRWHQIVGVVDAGAGEARLYVDGELASKVPFRGDLVDPKHPKWPLLIGGQAGDTGFTGLIDGFFDDVGVFKAALSPYLVQALYHTEATVRQEAELAEPDAPVTKWLVTVPAGLEGQYQIDLRTTDNLANRSFHPAAWRGIIDTLAPRITFTAQATGAQFNEGNGVTRAEVNYAYSAEDRYLSDKNFSGPCDGVSALVRDFADDADVAGLFPDLTLRNRLSTSCTVWEIVGAPARSVNACDGYGFCVATPPAPQGDSRSPAWSGSLAGATETSTSAQPSAPSPSWGGSGWGVDASEPSALLLNPTNHSLLAVDPGQVLTVTVAAQAVANLRQVVILLDGAAAATIDFAQASALKVAERRVAVKLPAFDPDKFEGEHTLVAQATDWAGNTQRTLFPATVVFDTHDPTVTLSNDKLTSADSYGLGNSLMRLRGNASDKLGLAAVQISVNDGPFSDVTFDEQGNWSTALWLGDNAAGKNLKFTLRAIDRAGHQTAMDKGLLVDVPPLPTLETTISAGPSDSLSETSATFQFSGVDAQGQPVNSFLCQLDAGDFTPCTSPQRYSGLAQGQHIFHVLASNDQGALDPTPAEWIWQIGTVTPPPPPTSKRIFLPLITRGKAQVQADAAAVDSASTPTAAATATAPAPPTSEEAPVETVTPVSAETPVDTPMPEAQLTTESAPVPASAAENGGSVTLYLPVIRN
ncbi:MAG: hypothetical protein DYG89_28680 [Caldilinea sp. CFX5]|nr:hypothetical protein [Caldilinea sp. CFX5]